MLFENFCFVSHSKQKFSNNTRRPTQEQSSKKCFRCGSNNHLASDSRCPAKNATCNFCKKSGHFSSVCSSKKNSDASKFQTDRFSKSKNQLSVKMNILLTETDSNLPTTSKPHATINISADRDVFLLPFLIDTGSDVSILPYSFFMEYRYFLESKLQPFTNAKLKNFDRSDIQIIGILRKVPCSFNGRSALLDFLLHDSDSAIIGVDAIFKLQITVSGKQSVETDNVQHFSDNNADIQTFSVDHTTSPAPKANEPLPEALPELSGYQFYIKLKADAPSTLIQKQRRIPFSLQNAVESEIKKLLMNDIIEEIDSSPYVSPIVVVPKPDGEIRLCVDYKRINQHIVVDQHPLPTADEIFAQLSGAKYFSKLDLRAAYHQLRIREDSRDLTAFTSHVGLFRYKRLPFGLANAPSAYMKVIFNILRDCANTVSYLDDILVFGATVEEHDECLQRTLGKLSEHGMTLNNKKCVYKQTSVQFLGRIIGQEGISPRPSTIEAIMDAPVPHDKPSLRSFLGLVNFYRNFIPNASLISSSLYDLLKDNITFTWTDVHQKDFENLKSCLANYIPLAFFNPDLQTATYLTTDASGYGISAVLSQTDAATGEEHPIFFLSRKLSDLERTYSVSEKEFLAVLWSIERLHQFLYGRFFTLRTDYLTRFTTLPDYRYFTFKTISA